MANTRRDFVGDGVTTVYDVSFNLGYVTKDHIYVYLDGSNYTEQLVYNWLSDNQIELSTPVGVGIAFSIRRVVPRDAPVNDYANGAILRESNLDASFAQLLMIGEEQADGYSGADSIWVETVNADYNRLLNLPEPLTDNEPTRKVDLDSLDDRVVTAEQTLLNTTLRVSSLESGVTQETARNDTQDVRLQTLESFIPNNVTSNVTYDLVNTVLGDKYTFGTIFDDVDAYDDILGRVYEGTATEQEVLLVDKINNQLGILVEEV